MEWFIAVVAIAALGVAAMAAAGGVGEMSAEPVYDVYRQQLPEGPLDAEDIRGARFGLALRGYAMVQVDDLLERLASEVAERDARIAELTLGAPPAGGAEPWFRQAPAGPGSRPDASEGS
jgi:DivIVA domain-containing protein